MSANEINDMLRQFISAEPQLEFRRQSVFQNQFLQLAKSYPDPIIIRTPRRFRKDKVTVHFLKYDVFMKTITHYRKGLALGLDFDASTDYMDEKDLDADIEKVAGLFEGFDDVSFNEKARYLYLDMQFKSKQDRQMLLGAFKMVWRDIEDRQKQNRTIIFFKDKRKYKQLEI